MGGNTDPFIVSRPAKTTEKVQYYEMLGSRAI